MQKLLPVVFRIEPANERARETLSQLLDSKLSSRAWSTRAPVLVDRTDDSSCTSSDDLPIRTVSLLWHVSDAYSGVDILQDRRELGDFQEILQMLSPLTVTGASAVLISYNGEFVGQIAFGNPDQQLREGLLDPWQTATR